MASEFSIRSDSVDVEQIMQQIRARIREKRGVDYTEDEIHELANIKLEKFLDPARLRSDLLQHYRERRPIPPAKPLPGIEIAPAPENYAFEGDTPYQSSRGAAGWLLFTLRRVLNPLLKLFINPNPIVHVLAMQSGINTQTTVRVDQLVEQLHRLTTQLNSEWLSREHIRRDLEALNYEIAHNLVLEMTRLSMEVKNMKMRVESISSRLDFAERRARALESVVQFRPGTGPAAEAPRPVTTVQRPAAPAAAAPEPVAPPKGEAQRKRRRRRRGRGGAPAQGQPGTPVADSAQGDRDEPRGDLFSEVPDAGQAGSDDGPEAGDGPGDQSPDTPESSS
jgi:DNA-binding transcriptional regulator YhcF (GntR family)